MYRIQRRWKVLITFTGTLIVFMTYVWFSSSTHTLEYATLTHVTADSVVLVNESGREARVTTPLDIRELIVVGEKYWFTYERKRWRQPKLLSIEP